jgi:hypothetical protein
MIYNQIAKQAIDFQKTAFNNWFDAVTMVQEQAVSAMAAMMKQSGLAMPEEAPKALKSWVNACQEGFKGFPFYVEIGFFGLKSPLVQEAEVAPAESPKLLTEEKEAAPAQSPKPVAKKKAAPAQKTKLAAK